MTFDPASIAFVVIAAGWLAYSGARLRDTRWVPVVPPLQPSATRRDPRVSIVVTARDEGARIEQTVQRLLRQEAVDLEIRVVDDRSRDDTGAILERLARADPRVHVVRVSELPPRWLGKNHACHVGALNATGEWILFADGDAWMQSDLVARAVAVADEKRADHVCFAPGETGSTLLARAALLHFWLGLIAFGSRANRDRPRGWVGVGAFNLVRASAYREIGGHERLRYEVIDDMKLGLLMRRAGFRSRIFDARRELEVHWAGTARGMARALEKNAFAMFNYRTGRALLAALFLAILYGTSIAAPFTGSPAGLLLGAAFLSSAIPAWILSRRSDWGAWAALLSPFMGVLIFVVLLNSTIVTLRQGGIRWRDTFYPLDELRRGQIPLTFS